MAAYQYVYVMKDLTKAYPGGREVFKGITLSFLPGVKTMRSTKMAPESLSISYLTPEPWGISMTMLMSWGTFLPAGIFETSMMRAPAGFFGRIDGGGWFANGLAAGMVLRALRPARR